MHVHPRNKHIEYRSDVPSRIFCSNSFNVGSIRSHPSGGGFVRFLRILGISTQSVRRNVVCAVVLVVVVRGGGRGVGRGVGMQRTGKILFEEKMENLSSPCPCKGVLERLLALSQEKIANLMIRVTNQMDDEEVEDDKDDQYYGEEEVVDVSELLDKMARSSTTKDPPLAMENDPDSLVANGFTKVTASAEVASQSSPGAPATFELPDPKAMADAMNEVSPLLQSGRVFPSMHHIPPGTHGTATSLRSFRLLRITMYGLHVRI